MRKNNKNQNHYKNNNKFWGFLKKKMNRSWVNNHKKNKVKAKKNHFNNLSLNLNKQLKVLNNPKKNK